MFNKNVFNNVAVIIVIKLRLLNYKSNYNNRASIFYLWMVDRADNSVCQFTNIHAPVLNLADSISITLIWFNTLLNNITQVPNRLHTRQRNINIHLCIQTAPFAISFSVIYQRGILPSFYLWMLYQFTVNLPRYKMSRQKAKAMISAVKNEHWFECWPLAIRYDSETNLSCAIATS